MRGTNDRGLFTTFVEAVTCFPPTARDSKSAADVYKASYEKLLALAESEPPYPRARAWRAYALALSGYEGWELPDKAPAEEKAMDRKAKLAKAKELGSAALSRDLDDYDLHWAMADIHLFLEEFDDAKREFKEALFLNGDERNPSLFAEFGSAMMQCGDLDQAQIYFRKARGPDWHLWMKGIMLFIKAGRAAAKSDPAYAPEVEDAFLGLALDELNATHAQIDDDMYQNEIQLVHAAAHWRRSEILRVKKSAGDPGNTPAHALRNKRAAERAIKAFRAVFKDWTADQACYALTLGDPIDKQYWRDAMTGLWKIPLDK